MCTANCLEQKLTAHDRTDRKWNSEYNLYIDEVFMCQCSIYSESSDY